MAVELNHNIVVNRCTHTEAAFRRLARSLIDSIGIIEVDDNQSRQTKVESRGLARNHSDSVIIVKGLFKLVFTEEELELLQYRNGSDEILPIKWIRSKETNQIVDDQDNDSTIVVECDTIINRTRHTKAVSREITRSLTDYIEQDIILWEQMMKQLLMEVPL